MEQGGEFDIEIFIPSGVDAASEAIYEISIKDTEGISQKTNVAVNQNSSQEAFIQYLLFISPRDQDVVLF